MKRISIIGLAIVAVLAMAAVVAQSASAALPELVNKEGKELVNKTITTESTENSVLENTRGETVTCTHEEGSVKAEGLKNVKEGTVTFTGCVGALNSKCTSSGQSEGTIVTNKVKGRIEYLSGKGTTSPVVGLLLEPETGTVFATFTCGSFVGNEVTKSLIGDLGPPNKLIKTTEFLTLKYAKKGTEKGIQEFNKFEGDATEHFLESKLFGFTTKANEQAKIKVKFGEEAQLKA